MRVQEPKARSYYLREAEAQGWDTRELECERTFATGPLPFLSTKAELTDEIERSRTRKIYENAPQRHSWQSASPMRRGKWKRHGKAVRNE